MRKEVLGEANEYCNEIQATDAKKSLQMNSSLLLGVCQIVLAPFRDNGRCLTIGSHN